MKIRSDFVTNSSSTAFILIRKGALTRDGVARLLGIPSTSPMKLISDALYEHLREASPLHERMKSYYEASDPMTRLTEEFHQVVADRVGKAIEAGHTVEMGSFRSEGGDSQSLFCCDSFELENDEYYLNALRSYW